MVLKPEGGWTACQLLLQLWSGKDLAGHDQAQGDSDQDKRYKLLSDSV